MKSYEALAYGSADLRFELLEKKLKDSIDIREVDENILKSLEMYKNGLYNNAAALRRIKSVYSIYDESPSFEVMKNSIKIILPKIESLRNQANGRPGGYDLSIAEEKLLNYINSCGTISRMDVEVYLGIRKTKATLLLNDLWTKKLIAKIGSGRTLQYALAGRR